MEEIDALASFILDRVAEREAATGDMADGGMLRDLVEWALVIEELRRQGDVGAPLRPVGLEVLRIVAGRWDEHPDFEAAWLEL